MDTSTKLLFDYLRDVIYDPENAKLDLDNLPEDMREFGKGMQYFADCVIEMTSFAKSLSKGELDVKPPSPENEIAAPLKALHATLKHLSWQAKQVAQGDYKQRIDFMGEFAQAFNTMTEQLEFQREELLKEIESRRQKAQALEQSNNLFEAVTTQISQWILVIDGTTLDWLYLNHDVESVINDPQCEPALRLWINQQVKSKFESHIPYTTKFELPGGDGIQYFLVEIYPLTWYEHDSLAFVFSDISVESKQMQNLQNAAYTDKMTKLFNRLYGMQMLSKWVDEKMPFILCFTDMDNLKYVNDRFGHLEGDRYIIAVAEVLQKFSPDAVLCRVGGDEFMLLAKGWHIEDAKNRMESLREALANSGSAEGILYNQSFSFGFTEVGADNSLTMSEILRTADERMYEYKRLHKMKRKYY